MSKYVKYEFDAGAVFISELLLENCVQHVTTVPLLCLDGIDILQMIDMLCTN